MTQPKANHVSEPGPSWEKTQEVQDAAKLLGEMHRGSTDYEEALEGYKQLAMYGILKGIALEKKWAQEKGVMEMSPEESKKHNEAMLSFFGDEKAAAPGEERKDCPRCGDLFYHPKVLLQDARQGAAEWEDMAKRAEKERDEARAEAASLSKELDAKKKEWLQLANDSVGFVKERDEAQAQLSSLKAENAALREELTKTKNSISACQIEWYQKAFRTVAKDRDTLRQQLADCAAPISAAIKALTRLGEGNSANVFVLKEALAKLKAGRKEG